MAESSNDLSSVGLVGLQRAEFARAIDAHGRANLARYAIVAIAVLSPFSDDPLLAYTLGAASLLATVLMFFFENRYEQLRSYAGRVRRATIITDGIGQPLAKAEDLDIRRIFNGSVADAKLRDDKEYFASKQPGGWSRLADHVAESAFWTQDLFEHSAQRSFVKTGVYVATWTVLLYAIIAFGSVDQIRVAVQAFCAALVLVVSRDELGAALAYHFGARRVRDVVQRLDRPGLSQADIMLIWSDYNAALEETPLVSPSVYASRKEVINALWQQQHASANDA